MSKESVADQLRPIVAGLTSLQIDLHTLADRLPEASADSRPGSLADIRATLECVMADRLGPAVQELARVMTAPNASGDERPTPSILLEQSELAPRLLELELLPWPERLEALRTPRFQVPGLLWVLLRESAARQLLRPKEAESAARLALRLVELLPELALSSRAAAITQAGSLAANACRLAGDHEAARRYLGAGALTTAPTFDRACFHRVLGLLHWDRGQLDQAKSTLEDAARLFARIDRLDEQAAMLALVGLVLAEERLPSAALPVLVQALAGLDDRRPWLAARTRLALAWAYGELGALGKARSARADAWRFVMLESRPEELLALFHLEALALGQLGERGEARILLEAVSRRWWLDGRPAEAWRTTLDLLAFLTPEEAVDLVAAMPDAPPSVQEEARQLLERLRGTRAAKELPESLRNLISSMRSSSRRLHTGLIPIPVH
jgi:hypothetical protein